MIQKIWRISIVMLWVCLMCGCTRSDTAGKKVRDLDFTVMGAEDISSELQQHIDERKENVFTLIYRDGEDMYLIVGYGQQTGGGFSIRVNDLYLGEKAICVSTSLEGPDHDREFAEDSMSFPYIVLKIETMDTPVIFDI